MMDYEEIEEQHELNMDEQKIDLDSANFDIQISSIVHKIRNYASSIKVLYSKI